MIFCVGDRKAEQEMRYGKAEKKCGGGEGRDTKKALSCLVRSISNPQ